MKICCSSVIVFKIVHFEGIISPFTDFLNDFRFYSVFILLAIKLFFPETITCLNNLIKFKYNENKAL